MANATNKWVAASEIKVGQMVDLKAGGDNDCGCVAFERVTSVKRTTGQGIVAGRTVELVVIEAGGESFERELNEGVLVKA